VVGDRRSDDAAAEHGDVHVDGHGHGLTPRRRGAMRVERRVVGYGGAAAIPCRSGGPCYNGGTWAGSSFVGLSTPWPCI
jgi:hypothetical protein